MNMINHDVELECKDFLNRLFDSHTDDALRKRALKALRFVMAGDKRLAGNYRYRITTTPCKQKDIRDTGAL